MIMSKPMASSRTVRVGTAYISIGILVGILQIFDALEPVLVSINAENVSPDIATWGGVGLAIIGGIQIWLRMITSQPIGNESMDLENDS
jgi:hypothetical protein